jgi:hypothetical protein
LQRTNCRADQLGNLLSALASLHQIFDLLYSLRRKFYLPSRVRAGDAKLCGLSHFCTSVHFFPGLRSIGAAAAHCAVQAAHDRMRHSGCRAAGNSPIAD